MKRHSALMAMAAALLLLAACVPSGASTFTTTKRYDAGELIVEPAPPTLVPVRAQRARFDLTHS